MKNVSTSPDPTFSSSNYKSEEDRTCPMCHAVFPPVVPQENFESHVVSHFEIENGFEVLAWPKVEMNAYFNLIDSIYRKQILSLWLSLSFY